MPHGFITDMDAIQSINAPDLISFKLYYYVSAPFSQLQIDCLELCDWATYNLQNPFFLSVEKLMTRSIY